MSDTLSFNPFEKYINLCKGQKTPLIILESPEIYSTENIMDSAENYGVKYTDVGVEMDYGNPATKVGSVLYGNEIDDIMSCLWKALDENENNKLEETELQRITLLSEDGDNGQYLTQKDLDIFFTNANNLITQEQNADPFALVDAEIGTLLDKYFPCPEGMNQKDYLDSISDEKILEAMFVEQISEKTTATKEAIHAYYATEGDIDDVYNWLKDNIFGGLTHKEIDAYLENEETIIAMLKEAVINDGVVCNKQLTDFLNIRLESLSSADAMTYYARNVLGLNNEQIAQVYEMAVNGYNSKCGDYQEYKDMCAYDWISIKVDENGNFHTEYTEAIKEEYTREYGENFLEIAYNQDYFIESLKSCLSLQNNQQQKISFQGLYYLYTGVEYNQEAIAELNMLQPTYEKALAAEHAASLQEELFTKKFNHPAHALKYFQDLHHCTNEEAVQYFNAYYETMFSNTHKNGHPKIWVTPAALQNMYCSSFRLSDDGQTIIEEYKVIGNEQVDIERLKEDGLTYNPETGIATRTYPMCETNPMCENQQFNTGETTGFPNVFEGINEDINTDNLYVDTVMKASNQYSEFSYKEIISQYEKLHQNVYGADILNEKFGEYRTDMDSYSGILSGKISTIGFLLSFVNPAFGWVALGGAITDNVIDGWNIATNETDGEARDWFINTLSEVGIMAVGMKLGSWANKMGSKTAAYLNALPEESWIAKLAGGNINISPALAHKLGIATEFTLDVASGTVWDMGVSLATTGEFEFGEILVSNLIFGSKDVQAGMATYRAIKAGEFVDIGNGLLYRYNPTTKSAEYVPSNLPNASIVKNADGSWLFKKDESIYDNASFARNIVQYNDGGKIIDFDILTGRKTLNIKSLEADTRALVSPYIESGAIDPSKIEDFYQLDYNTSKQVISLFDQGVDIDNALRISTSDVDPVKIKEFAEFDSTIRNQTIERINKNNNIEEAIAWGKEKNNYLKQINETIEEISAKRNQGIPLNDSEIKACQEKIFRYIQDYKEYGIKGYELEDTRIDLERTKIENIYSSKEDIRITSDDVKEMFPDNKLPEHEILSELWGPAKDKQDNIIKEFSTDCSETTYQIAAMYMDALDKDMSFWNAASGIDGLTRKDLLLNFAKYTETKCSAGDYINIAENNPLMFKEIMYSMLDSNTSLAEFKSAVRYKSSSWPNNSGISSNNLNFVISQFRDKSNYRYDYINYFQKNPELIGEINKLTQLLENNELKFEHTLYRGSQVRGELDLIKDSDGVGAGEKIQKFFTENKNPSKEEVESFVNNLLTGHGFLQDRFMSTTASIDLATEWATSNKINGGAKENVSVVWEIEAPEGTKALFLESQNKLGNGLGNYDQYEFLLQRNTYILCEDASYDPETGVIHIKVDIMQTTPPPIEDIVFDQTITVTDETGTRTISLNSEEFRNMKNISDETDEQILKILEEENERRTSRNSNNN